jgi:hypothetical protein
MTEAVRALDRRRPACLVGLLVHEVAYLTTGSLDSLCAKPSCLHDGARMIVEQHGPGCRTLWFTPEDVDCMACIAARSVL